nr:unknown protein [synthetic construct]
MGRLQGVLFRVIIPRKNWALRHTASATPLRILLNIPSFSIHFITSMSFITSCWDNFSEVDMSMSSVGNSLPCFRQAYAQANCSSSMWVSTTRPLLKIAKYLVDSQ